MQIDLDSTVLDTLLRHGTAVARCVGDMDDPAAGALADDENASMTMVEADPDIALAELVRYAQADAA